MGIPMPRCTLAWLIVSTFAVAPLPLLAQETVGARHFERLGLDVPGAGVQRPLEGAPIVPVPQAHPARARGALWGGGATVFAPSRSAVASKAGASLAVVPVAGIDRFGTVVRLSW